MISAIKHSNIILKTLLCVFSLLLLSGSAFAWDQSFEGSENDISTSVFVGSGGAAGGTPVLSASEHGYAMYSSNIAGIPDYTGYLTINEPWLSYLGFSVKYYKNAASTADININMYNGSTVVWTSPTIHFNANSADFHRVEIIESSGGLGASVYLDGLYVGNAAFSGSKSGITKTKITLTGTPTNYFYEVWLDDFTTTSSHGMIGSDDLCYISDLGQYFRLGVPNAVTGKSYYVRLYSPTNKVAYTKTFTNSTNLVEQLIPIANLTEIGEYTLHLYRSDDEDTNTYLNMKRFEVTDPLGSNEGSIDLSKVDYESGENVDFWVHLNNYAAGYKVVCDFTTAGSNFKKTVDVTSDTFKGSFSIPAISNVIGSHTAYLLNPSGGVVDSAEFNCYIPGLADIALDKNIYERTDNALVYYKNVKTDSTVSVSLRYGGSTASTLTYDVEGNGVITLDLDSLASADSIIVSIKDADGYTVDNDNSKIVIGTYKVVGRVYDAKTGSVISNATVTVQGNSVNSDTNGNYNITALAGFANYSIARTGYNAISGTVAVFDLETIHNFYLSPVIENGGTGVFGTVVSSKTDYPLSGASVEVTNTDTLKRYSTIVDNKGYYSISNNDLTGNLSIKVSFNNYDSIVSSALVSAGTMQNINFRLNAVTGYVEIDPSEHSGGTDSSDTGETAEERAYKEKYGEMGKHPFDFNSDGVVENSEWKYAGERFIMLIGILAFMGFIMLINRRR